MVFRTPASNGAVYVRRQSVTARLFLGFVLAAPLACGLAVVGFGLGVAAWLAVWTGGLLWTVLACVFAVARRRQVVAELRGGVLTVEPQRLGAALESIDCVTVSHVRLVNSQLTGNTVILGRNGYPPCVLVFGGDRLEADRLLHDLAPYVAWGSSVPGDPGGVAAGGGVGP